MVMCSRGRHLIDLRGLICRNTLTCSSLVGDVSYIVNLFREFDSPRAVPIHQIVHMEMMEMMMDDFVDDAAQTFLVHWEGRVDKNVLLVDI